MEEPAMTSLQMYDLAGRDEALRFSPFCWRTRFAVAHKRLPLRTVPWHYTDKAQIAPFGADRVPVLLDGDTPVSDSWRIAAYLEDTYPDRPSLFGGDAGRGVARVVSNWADLSLHPLILRMKIGDVFRLIDERDRDYFRKTREARFGRTIEQLVADAPGLRQPFLQALDPIRKTVETQPFLSGNEPLYADYIVCAALQWIRVLGGDEVLESGDPLLRWREDVLERYQRHLAGTA